jgi:hypothetical protein
MTNTTPHKCGVPPKSYPKPLLENVDGPKESVQMWNKEVGHHVEKIWK